MIAFCDFNLFSPTCKRPVCISPCCFRKRNINKSVRTVVFCEKREELEMFQVAS